MNNNSNVVILKDLEIDTYKESVIYLRSDSEICRSEGFEALARIKVQLENKSILATLNIIGKEALNTNEASLSKYAFELLGAKVGDKVNLSHPLPLQSLSYIRSKVYNKKLSFNQIQQIINDVAKGYFTDTQLAMFITACASGNLDQEEIYHLSKSMVEVGEKISWSKNKVVDKHCVGGLPGNRTTLIVVPIVASFGLFMPKTSSRAITSPSGTADTMEVLAPVNLDLNSIKNVVKKENGCIGWGGEVNLSPADDILIRVERSLNLDNGGQLVASVLSKKVAAGSTDILIDIPVGTTAKIRNLESAYEIENLFYSVGNLFNVNIRVFISDGSQPVGRGIGPALESQDIIDVLRGNDKNLIDLKERSLTLAGMILEFSEDVPKGQGKNIAAKILESGKAWQKFQDICNAQGGMKQIPKASFTHEIKATKTGRVISIDNRILARLAKLAGAPKDKAAGVYFKTKIDENINKGDVLFVIHAESKGKLNYALSFLEQGNNIIELELSE